MFTLLTLTCVSAADDNQTIDDAVLESDAVTGEILTDSVGDFTELNTNITNTDNALKLDKNYAFNPDEDTGFTDGIVITKNNYVIDGDGHTISGANQSRIFNIQANNVTLKNINFINGWASGNGGAIYFNKFGTVENCNFTNNSVKDTDRYNGGAIYFENDGTVIGSSFENNNAYYGGAICFNNNGTVENTAFYNNNATHMGGAIYFRKNGTVENSNFTNNRGYGGAAVNTEKNVFIKNSNFNNNTAIEYDGGGVLGVYGIIDNCNFTDNYAGHNCAAVKLIGGVVTNCNFTKNTCDAYGILCFTEDGGIIENCTFTDNRANNVGGAVNAKKTNITNCIFNNNEAHMGAAIHGYDCNITGCSFRNNNASDSMGGAVYGRHKIINCNFTNNTATEGGAIYFNGASTVINCNFTDNHAQTGGAILATDNITIEGSYFAFNTAAEGVGGAIRINGTSDGNKRIVESSTFISNSASDGGAIYIWINGELYNNQFIANTASENGGAVVMAGTIYSSKNKYINNTAGSGGALYAEYHDSELYYDVFDGNVATDGTNHVSVDGDVKINASFTTPEDLKPYKTAKITILNITDEVTYGETVNITVNITCDDKPLNGGIVYITINNKDYFADVENGNAIIHIPNLNAGTYEDNITYMGDSIYTKPSQSVAFVVSRAIADISINLTDIVYGDVFRTIVNVASNGTPVNVGNVTLNFNLGSLTVNVTDGIALFEIPNLNADSYSGNVIFDAGDNYNKPGTIVSFVVSPAIAGISLNLTDIVYGDVFRAIVNVASNGTPVNVGNVTLNFNLGSLTVNVTDGIALFEIPNLNATSYSGNIVFDGGNNYNKPGTIISFVVSPADISLDLTDIKYGDALKVNVKSNAVVNQGTVTLTFNNNAYTSNVIDGVAIFKISDLAVGSYSGNFSFNAGTNYQKASKLISFNVVKRDIDITAPNKVYVINYGGTYSVTLKGIAGEKVTFTLNGKNIGSAKTNANGVATIKLTAKILKAAKTGKKNLVVKIDSDKYQGSKTAKITINKEKTKLVAKNKKFKKAKKIKKYTVILKNSKSKAVKKVWVTLKVKGKTYKAKTNAKGKAIFKIKKLNKKGTYKATIKFKGNAYYKAVTKKVKIKIK